MLPILAAIVAVLCAAASARRVWLAATATALHPDEVLRAIGDAGAEEGLASFREAAEREPRAEWERDLLGALSTGDDDARAALVNEQLTELDHRIQRWSRVPRVCASIASSSGLLLATLVLRRGLSDATVLTGDVGELVVRGLVGDALTVAALGMVGTSFCIAAQAQAKRIASARAAAADKLVEKLEAWACTFPPTVR